MAGGSAFCKTATTVGKSAVTVGGVCETGESGQVRACGPRLTSAPAVTIQYNHEWTRINTNGNNRTKLSAPPFTGSLNGDASAGPQNRTRNDFIRVNSCPFVVFYCMDTAQRL